MEEIRVQDSSLSDLDSVFPPRKSISVLGTMPRKLEDFNALFLAELKEASGFEADANIELVIPAGALEGLNKVVSDLLSGEIDNEPLKYLIVILAQTSILGSTTWSNFKVSLNMILDSFQMLPQVAAILEGFTGTDQERLYAQDRICAKAIFSQALQQL